jgi:hypothetical protein
MLGLLSPSVRPIKNAGLGSTRRKAGALRGEGRKLARGKQVLAGGASSRTGRGTQLGAEPWLQYAESTSARRGACCDGKARGAATLSPFSSHATQFPARCVGTRLFLPRSGHRKIATRRRGLCGDRAWPTMPAHPPGPTLRLREPASPATSLLREPEPGRRPASHDLIAALDNSKITNLQPEILIENEHSVSRRNWKVPWHHAHCHNRMNIGSEGLLQIVLFSGRVNRTPC